ncbi:MAG TPA: sulfotransferase [Candidatus Limnocylindrales bacterium]|nr:sulfotransferase [Candidatus Limnocylindrales bacterium]
MSGATSRDQRLPVRLFNGAVRTIEKVSRKRTSFVQSEQALREAAIAAAGGLTDFGKDDYGQGLQVLLRSYDEESHLNPFGRWLVRQQLVAILRNRLVAEEAWRRCPQMLATPVERPIFVLGLPRTGTTALHSLLAQDPANQVLEYWLAAAPKARPSRSDWERDPCFKQAAQGLKLTYWLDPSLKAIHLMTADGPEECRHLLQQCFTDDSFECNSTLPSYSRWYAGCDMEPPYRRHRDLLRLIGANDSPRRWVLKYPAHLRHLRALLKIYPDACVVQTHRDPARVLPSLCSLIAGWRGIYEDEPDKHAIAAWTLELWASTMENAMAVRQELGEARFYDLHFRETVADPAGAVGRMYAHFGIEYPEETAQSLRRWHRDNPQHKHGEHRYSAADFGLTAQGMRERFAAYIDRFAIEAER